MSLTPMDRRRQLAAKRTNERLKLATGFLNALAIGVVGAAFIIPGVTDFATVRWSWFPVAFVLHFVAQLTLQFLASED